MGQATGKKICVLCGEDCSNRKRVKDPKGRYYCRACHEAAQRQRDRVANDETAEDIDFAALSHAGETQGGTTMDATALDATGMGAVDTGLGAASSLAAARAAFIQDGSIGAGDSSLELGRYTPPPPAVPDPTSPPGPSASTDPDSAADQSPEADDFDAGTSAHAARRCPKCMAVVAADAASCSACGAPLDVDVHAQAMREARRARDRKPNIYAAIKSDWPHYVGMCSRYVGWLELPVVALWFLIAAWRALTSGNIAAVFRSNWRIGVGMGLAALLAALAWWLTKIGSGLQHRMRHAALSARRWAALKIIICGAGFGTWLTLAPDGLADPGVTLFAASMVWLLVWPTFMLFWLSRREIQHQVVEWGRAGT